MKFMLTFKAEKEPPPGVSACKAYLPEMAELMGKLKSSGVLVWTEALLPAESGARIRFDGGKMPVLDGPFAEAKELVAGFAVVEVPTKERAVEIAKQFLRIAGEGECDIRQVFEPDTAKG
jgi:hypothetical protein